MKRESEPLNIERKIRTASLLCFFLFLSVFSENLFAQNEAKNPQDQIVSRLATSDEEQKQDALVQLGAHLASSPGSSSYTTISAISNLLQSDQSAVVRALAARAMELANDSRFVNPLLAALRKERQVAVRKAIIYALARYSSTRTPQVGDSLLLLAKDKNHEVRAAAVYALAESAGPIALNMLIEVLQKRRKSNDDFARSQAARGLGRIASREAIDPLLKALSSDKSDDVRRESAKALGNIATKQDVKVIQSLRQATLSSDPYLTIAADLALTSIDSRGE